MIINHNCCIKLVPLVISYMMHGHTYIKFAVYQLGACCFNLDTYSERYSSVTCKGVHILLSETEWVNFKNLLGQFLYKQTNTTALHST